ncbi:MAG: hypothetical protein ACLT1T_08645 [Oscillospiraceae bacterium]
MKKNSTDSRKAHAMLTVSRVLVYALLIFLSILCLFSFYMLIVNASRTNADLQGGFKALPQGISWRISKTHGTTAPSTSHAECSTALWSQLRRRSCPPIFPH